MGHFSVDVFSVDFISVDLLSYNHAKLLKLLQNAQLLLYSGEFCIQVGESSGNFSTLSMKESDALSSAISKMAIYKGQKVAICTVDKTEISLTRQDLIELINVCSLLLIFISPRPIATCSRQP